MTEPYLHPTSEIKLAEVSTQTIIPSSLSSEIGERLLAIASYNINLIKLTPVITKSDLRQIFPIGQLIACDFYVEGMEQDEFIGSGFQDLARQITNIDHHAPKAEMFRQVSSGNLAIEYVLERGSLPAEAITIINHTDCDSIISALIMRGYLPPEKIFFDAVLAADHTGQVNPISDLLQALDPKRSINFSVRNLAYLLQGKPLAPEAQQLLAERHQGRQETEQALQNGAVIQEGLVTVVRLSDNMRNEFLPALFPKAAVIMTTENGDSPDTWIARLRLGMAAPPSFTLFSLDLQAQLDPKIGGRWNAMANKRGGGTSLAINDYISRLNNLALRQLS